MVTTPPTSAAAAAAAAAALLLLLLLGVGAPSSMMAKMEYLFRGSLAVGAVKKVVTGSTFNLTVSNRTRLLVTI